MTGGGSEAVRSLDLRAPAHLVSRRAPWMWAVGGLWQVALLVAALVAATLVWDWFSFPAWAWLLVVLAGLLYVVIMPIVRYRVHRWETTEKAVYTQTGWLSRQRLIAPMSRVQTVDFSQGPVQRLLGLASVRVNTASAAGPVMVRELDRATAEALVEELTRRTEDEPGDAT